MALVLPHAVLFVCNLNTIRSPMAEGLMARRFAKRIWTRSCGVRPGEEVDGMDVEAVFAAGRKAVEHCRRGEGPYILEMKTYRYRGHSMSDPAKYRTKEEVQEMREKHDPIEGLRARMLAAAAIDEAGLKAIDKEIKDIVAQAAEFAQMSPEPDPKELWTDVYA